MSDDFLRPGVNVFRPGVTRCQVIGCSQSTKHPEEDSAGFIPETGQWFCKDHRAAPLSERAGSLILGVGKSTNAHVLKKLDFSQILQITPESTGAKILQEVLKVTRRDVVFQIDQDTLRDVVEHIATMSRDPSATDESIDAGTKLIERLPDYDHPPEMNELQRLFYTVAWMVYASVYCLVMDQGTEDPAKFWSTRMIEKYGKDLGLWALPPMPEHAAYEVARFIGTMEMAWGVQAGNFPIPTSIDEMAIAANTSAVQYAYGIVMKLHQEQIDGGCDSPVGLDWIPKTPDDCGVPRII